MNRFMVLLVFIIAMLGADLSALAEKKVNTKGQNEEITLERLFP